MAVFVAPSDTPSSPTTNGMTSGPGAPRRMRIPDTTRTREYVAGGTGLWSATAGKSLPISIDDLTDDFGLSIYDQMLLDPQVAACVIVLKASIIEDGLTLAPALADQEDPKYKQGVRIKEDADRMIRLLETPIDDVLWSMLDAAPYGNKVAELVSIATQEPDGRPTLRIRAIKPKPRESVAYVVDAYLNVLGLLGAEPGRMQPVGQGQVIEPTDPRILPRDKFAILTWHPLDNDPRGSSVLRPAYEPWWRLRQLMPEYLRYLSQFASPSMWASTPPGVSASPTTDGLGNLLGPDGQPIDPNDPQAVASATQLTPIEELLGVLLAYRNGTAMAVPDGTQVHTIEMQGDGSAFLRAFAECHEQIFKAILCQQLATEAGEPVSRAASVSQQDILDTIVRQGKRSLVRMITYDILIPWVERNYGKAAVELVPIVTLGTTERKDQAPLMAATAALMRAAYLHPSQLRATDELLGLPVRDLSQPVFMAQPTPSPAPGEPSALPGGVPGTGGQKPAPQSPSNPGGPSGPAQRGGGAPANPPQPSKAADAAFDAAWGERLDRFTEEWSHAPA